MITEVIFHNNQYADLAVTLTSITATEAFGTGKVHVLICSFLTKEQIQNACAEYMTKYPQQISTLHTETGSFASQFEQVMNTLHTEYVHFMHSGDKLVLRTLKSGEAYFIGKNKKNADKNVIAVKPAEHGGGADVAEDEGRLSVSKAPYQIPTELNNLFLKREFLERLLKEKSLNKEYIYFGEFELLARIYEKEELLYLTEYAAIIQREDCIENELHYSNASKVEWYEEFFCFADNVCEKNVKEHMQYMLFYIIRFMFVHNLNSRDKHVYYGESFELFAKRVGNVLKKIDDRIIANINDFNRFLLERMITVYLFKLKYEGDSCFRYVTESSRASVYLAVNDVLIVNVTDELLRIDVIDSNEKEFVLDCAIRVFAKDDDFKLRARLKKKELCVEETYHYNHIKVFGQTIDRRHVYRVHVPFDLVKTRGALAFYSDFQGYRHVLPIKCIRFTSKLNSEVPYAYLVYRDHIIDLRPDNKRLFFTPYTKRAHFGHERRYLKELKGICKAAYDLRIAYYANYHKYKKQNIWITFDKLYKGGDCGEYFYKYAATQKDDVNVEYLITKDTLDAVRLEKEGYKPLYFGTMEHKLKFLFAKVVAATHANIPIYSGLDREEFEYVKDLFDAKVVCIQHGLAVQQLALNCNQVYDNTKTFYVASKQEVENLSKPIYGYEEGQIELTGIPRFDGLKNDDQKQILISPTWRSYIAMPPSVGSQRPYSPTFKETDYFKIYQNLIADKRLVEAAKKYGYHIIYLLHPTIASQIDDYMGNEVVNVMSPVGASYEKMLTQSSLMITDYSGVQFDFAYMRKPIIYYHPDKLPPHYDEGGFFYDTMGFGEIVKEEDELINLLVNYMENKCQMTDFYRKRADDFFAYDDDKSCERIYKSLKNKAD